MSGNATFHGRTHVGPLHGPTVHETVNFSGSVTGQLSFQVNHDWTIGATTHPSLALSKADIKFLNRITISVKGPVENAFNSAAPAAANTALQKAIENLHLREKAAGAWSALHVRQRISESPAVWIEVKPTEIRVQPLSVQGDALVIGASIVAATEVFVEQAAPPVPTTALPGAVIDPNATNKFDMVLPVESAFDQISAKVNETLRDKVFEEEGVKLTISAVECYTSSDKVVIGVTFSATHGATHAGAKGKLYAVGSVAYDEKSGMLTLNNLEYDLQTKNVVVKLADWLLKPRILQEASEKAKVNVGPLLADAKDRCNAVLASIALPKGVSAKLNVGSMDLDDVKISQGRLFLLVRADGTSDVQLTDIPKL
jgi:hypothetical protein